ncbi:hypothetical protein ABFS83_14G236700 [Erythranthe nasuta]
MAEFSVKNLAAEWLMGTAADMPAQIGHAWVIIRASFLVPLLRFSLYICLVSSTMLFLEWVYIGAVLIYVKLSGRNPENIYKCEPISEDDSEIGAAAFPMVLVQIPLCNEKEVYKLSIGAACNLSWPADRLLIQVIDGSSDSSIRDMIEKECMKWLSKGVNIKYQMRQTKGGYKAGALKEGSGYDYVKECEHVVIFDSDFQPGSDFLRRAVPFLVHNPEIGLVQARWRFVNADECLLTRLQEISLDYHFMAEQEVGSSAHAFFGFNGSAGIWRIAAINEAGGWDDRTTSEDMDLAIRAGLLGWKLVYVGTLQVNSELPSTFKAFRSQQHRWFCGPTNLFRKIVMDIFKSKKVSLWNKVYMIYNFFVVRKIIGHTCVFFSYCVVLPLTVLLPEVDVPKAGAVFVPCIIGAINSIYATPRSLHLIFLWILFESAMSFHRTKAIFTGLLGSKNANQWVVTQKHGDAVENKAANNIIESTAPKESRFKILRNRILLPELGIAVFVLWSGCYGFLYSKDYYFIYLFIQAITLTMVGFGFVGKILPN